MLRDDIIGFLDWLVLRDEQSPYGSDGIPELEAVIYQDPDKRRKTFEKLVDLYLKEKDARIKNLLRRD